MGIEHLITFRQPLTFAGTTTVKVSVDDVNDNAPYFEPSVPVGQLTENQDPFSQVAIDLAALTEDDDLPPNQNPYRYVPPNLNPYRYVPPNQNPYRYVPPNQNPYRYVPPNQNPYRYVPPNQNLYRYVPPNQNPYRDVPPNQNPCLPTNTHTGMCLPNKTCASQPKPVPVRTS